MKEVGEAVADRGASVQRAHMAMGTPSEGSWIVLEMVHEVPAMQMACDGALLDTVVAGAYSERVDAEFDAVVAVAVVVAGERGEKVLVLILHLEHVGGEEQDIHADASQLHHLT